LSDEHDKLVAEMKSKVSEEMSKLWKLWRESDHSHIEPRWTIIDKGTYKVKQFLGFYGLKCVVCGAEFGGRFTPSARFCSSECYHKYRYQRRKARGLYPKRELRNRVCVVCGASFKSKMLRAEYCSQSCRNRAHYHPRPKPSSEADNITLLVS